MLPVLSLITLSTSGFAQGIGTWSAERSPDPLVSSTRYEELRERLGKELPHARLVPLHTLSTPVLAMLDVLILDGHGQTALTQGEQDALLGFVRYGGVLVADVSGPTGASIASAFGVSPGRTRHGAPHVDLLPEGAFSGPLGEVRRFGTHDAEHLATTVEGAVSVGDADGAHLISLRPGRGQAVFIGDMSAFADSDARPPGQFSQPSADNGALLMNLIASAMPAPKVGTWSASRSTIGFASSDAFDLARKELRSLMPGLTFVELDRLDQGKLDDLDALLLDSTPQTPLSPAELDALRAFVASGGSVVAQVYGPMGNALAGLYNLAVVGTPQAAVHTLPITAGVESPALHGPFGSVSTYANRYESALGTTVARTEAVPLVQGPAGTHVVYVPFTPAHGSALLLTNLFAFGDPDWSVGGLAGGKNDNLALLGNFLAATIRTRTTPIPQGPGDWRSDYLQAAAAGVRSDLEPLRAWSERYRDEPEARELVNHVTTWIASPPEGVDPRFFPINGIVLGTTSRKDLRTSGYRSNGESKWTFDIGGLVWTCVEQKEDFCDLTHTSTEIPAIWAAAGLQTTLTPDELAGQFERLGYRVTIGVASQSPFGRQVVASGFGLLWQADYSLKEQGERLLILSARRKR